MLEKTLESPLDCKKIQPVYPKGDQSWIFIGRDWYWSWSSNTLATWCEGLIGKDPDAWKDWGQEEKGTTEDEMVGWHHWLNGHGFGWTPGISDGQGEAWRVVVHGLTKSQTQLSDWTDDYSNLGFYLNTGISISLSHHHDVTMFMASWTSPVLSGFPHLSFQQSDTLGSLVAAFSFALQLMVEYLSIYNSYPSEAPAKKPSVRTIFTPFTLLCLLHTETTHDNNFQELAGVPRVRETCYVTKPPMPTRLLVGNCVQAPSRWATRSWLIFSHVHAASCYTKNQATTELPRVLENYTNCFKINRKASHFTIFG